MKIICTYIESVSFKPVPLAVVQNGDQLINVERFNHESRRSIDQIYDKLDSWLAKWRNLSLSVFLVPFSVLNRWLILSKTSRGLLANNHEFNTSRSLCTLQSLIFFEVISFSSYCRFFREYFDETNEEKVSN